MIEDLVQNEIARIESGISSPPAKQEREFHQLKTMEGVRQKSFAEKLAGDFFNKVLKRRAISMLYEALSDLLDMSFGKYSGIAKSFTRDLTGYATTLIRDYDPEMTPYHKMQSQKNNLAKKTYDDITIPSKAKAMELLDILKLAIQENGSVSVAELYSVFDPKYSGDFDRSFTDNNFGWKSLEKATIVRNGIGWSIMFPPVQQL